MRRLGLATVLMLCCSSVAFADPITMRGGPFDGLRVEATTTGQMQFLPGVVAPSPVPPAQRAAIDRFLDLARRGRSLGALKIRPIALSGVPLERRFHATVATCRGDEPYSIDDETVRVSWLCNGRLAWISIYTFSANRIEAVRFGPAEVPRFVEAPVGN